MKFKISADILKNELANVGIARDRRGDGGVMDGIYIGVSGGKIKLSGNNREYSITKEFELGEGYAGGECEFVADKDFIDIVNKLDDGEVAFTYFEDGKVEIKQRGFKCIQQVMSAQNFILRELGENRIGMQKIDKAELKLILDSVTYACAKQEYNSTNVLMGIKIAAKDGNIQAAALDGNRIAIYTGEYNGSDIDIILPARVLKDTIKIMEDDIEIEQYDSAYVVKSGGYTLTINGLSGAFPNYERFLKDDYTGEIFVPVKELTNAVDRLNVITKQKKAPIVLEYDSGTLKLSVNRDKSNAAEVIGGIDDSLNDESKPIRIGFDSTFLLEALEATTGTAAKIKYTSELKPMVIESQSAINVVCPLRLGD